MAYLSLTVDSAKTNLGAIPSGLTGKYVDRTEWNELVNGLRGLAVSGKHWVGYGGNTADPFAATLGGLGAGRAHQWWDSTDDGFKYRVSGATAERQLLDDQGIGVLKLDSYAGVTLAPTGKLWLRSNGGALQSSYNGGAWTALGGGGGAYTGSLGVSLVGADFRLDLAYAPTWTGNHAWATTKTLTFGANVLVSGDKLIATQLSGIVPVANGGTGVVGQTAGSLLVAAGASAMTALAVGAAGTLLIGGASPAYSATPYVTTMGIGSATAVVLQSPADGVMMLKPNAAVPVASQLRGAGGSGSNVAGAALILAAGPGTGTAACGPVEIWQHVNSAVSGSTASTLVKSWEFASPGGGGGDGTIMDGAFLPATDAAASVGSASKQVKDLFLSGGVYVGNVLQTFGGGGVSGVQAIAATADTAISAAKGVYRLTGTGTCNRFLTASLVAGVPFVIVLTAGATIADAVSAGGGYTGFQTNAGGALTGTGVAGTFVYDDVAGWINHVGYQTTSQA